MKAYAAGTSKVWRRETVLMCCRKADLLERKSALMYLLGAIFGVIKYRNFPNTCLQLQIKFLILIELIAVTLICN